MDNSRLYAKHNNGLEVWLSAVEKFSDNIEILFCLNEYAKITLKKGLLVKSKNITRDKKKNKKKPWMTEHNKTYWYLGSDEANGINHTINKEKMRKELYWRIRAILRRELNVKKKK